MLGERNKIAQFGKCATGDHIHFLSCMVSTRPLAGDIIQAQFNHGLLQKRGFFGVGIQKRNLQIGRQMAVGMSLAARLIHQRLGIFDIRQQVSCRHGG